MSGPACHASVDELRGRHFLYGLVDAQGARWCGVSLLLAATQYARGQHAGTLMRVHTGAGGCGGRQGAAEDPGPRS